MELKVTSNKQTPWWTHLHQMNVASRRSNTARQKSGKFEEPHILKGWDKMSCDEPLYRCFPLLELINYFFLVGPCFGPLCSLPIGLPCATSLCFALCLLFSLLLVSPVIQRFCCLIKKIIIFSLMFCSESSSWEYNIKF